MNSFREVKYEQTGNHNFSFFIRRGLFDSPPDVTLCDRPRGCGLGHLPCRHGNESVEIFPFLMKLPAVNGGVLHLIELLEFSDLA